MAYYTNQKTIVIHFPKNASATGVRFTTLQAEWSQKVYRKLDGVKEQRAVLLWNILIYNQDGFELDFSPAFVAKYYGHSAEYWRQAENILEDYGIIALDDNGILTFYVDIDESTGHKPKRSIPPNKGQHKNDDKEPTPKSKVGLPSNQGYPYPENEGSPTSKSKEVKSRYNILDSKTRCKIIDDAYDAKYEVLPYVQVHHYSCGKYKDVWQQLKDDELVDSEEEVKKRINELQREAEYQYHAFHFDRQ